ncbi:ABC transporter permease [Streptomyces silaceus]|uniref:ABC transporter permease n=1 Tax=Streptomyces silaceus TaxID=545123 RepID=UPI0006EBDC97|nr:ABC transporter permease [Streptomyces silaceus]
MSTLQMPQRARRLARPLIAVRFHWLSLWNWRQVYYGRIVEPIAYLLFLAAGIGGAVAAGHNQSLGAYLAFVVPGMFAMLAFRSGTAAVSDVANDRKWGVFALYTLHGGGPAGYLSSIITILGSVFLAQLALVLILAAALGGLTDVSAWHLTSTVLTALFVDAGWIAAGAAVAARVQSYAARDFLLTITALPVVLAAPLFYPLDSAPGYLRALAHADPLTYQVAWLRGTWSGDPSGLLWAALWAAIAATVAVPMLTRADRVTRER